MKKRFVIKKYTPKKDDVFFMTESSDFLAFFCVGYKDLRDAMRCINPKAYMPRSSAWLSKYLKLHNNHLVLLNPFFRHKNLEIVEIQEDLSVINTVKIPIKYERITKGKFVVVEFEYELKQVHNDEFERCLSIYKKGGQHEQSSL